MTAYQEALLSLEELRQHMPDLRQREQRLRAELQSLNAQSADRANYLRLTQTLSAFLGRLRESVDNPGYQRASTSCAINRFFGAICGTPRRLLRSCYGFLVFFQLPRFCHHCPTTSERSRES
ncbi:MAG: hypothetical protein ACYCUY_07095 [Acidithiobacillus sp.]